MGKGAGPESTWREAFWRSPGPRTAPEAALLWLKGVCMGAADIIPGVSGGTIALVTGIYDDLLGAIKSADTTLVRRLLALDLKGALAHVHLRFLAALLLGIAAAIITLARVMNTLLHQHPVLTWSFFFGLIAASVLVVGRRAGRWKMGTVAGFAAGALAGWLIVGLIPVETPETLEFVFFSGMVAICAMILPGISGAFILLILGKYAYVTATLKNPFLPANMVVIVVFATGCLIGLMGFSRVLNFLLNRYFSLTMAFLTGLMTGAMRKIWPWKEVVESVVIRGKEHVLMDRNVLPTVDEQFLLALALAAAGFCAVLVLERMSHPTKS
jgi:putative membrane protein